MSQQIPQKIRPYVIFGNHIMKVVSHCWILRKFWRSKVCNFTIVIWKVESYSHLYKVNWKKKSTKKYSWKICWFNIINWRVQYDVFIHMLVFKLKQKINVRTCLYIRWLPYFYANIWIFLQKAIWKPNRDLLIF